MKYKYVTLDGREIIFRGLSAEESDRYCQRINTDDVNLEEYIFGLITDNQYKLDGLEADIIPMVIFLSFKVSGVLRKAIDFPNYIERARGVIKDNAYYLLYSTIIKANPGRYSVEDLKGKTLNELIELYVVSEMVLGRDVIDTVKAKQLIGEAEAKTAPVPPKTGVKAFTEEEISFIQQLLDDNPPGDM